MPPFAGQGANQGIEDVAILSNLLLSPSPFSLSQIATKYASLRVPRTHKVVKFASDTGTLMMGEGFNKYIRNLMYTLPLPHWVTGRALDWLYREKVVVEGL